MTLLPRKLQAPDLMLALLLAAAPSAFAQQTPPAAEAPRESAAATDDAVSTASLMARSGQEVRNDFSMLLRQSPNELATILVLDPTLLSNEAFLTGYPELSRFVAAHPEVRHNPGFYLGEFTPSQGRQLDHVLEPILVAGAFLVVAFALGWLIRTLIEQRRWTRLSRTQSEVHNKILERFGNSEALLEYMRTPAGSKFLESAPIPLHAEQPSPNAPLSRALWSIQIGIVVAGAALGMIAVSGRFDPETAQGFFALGMIALCAGGGFILSAAVSIILSRRLGLWPSSTATATADLDDAGMR
jgi:hypothetical protein